MSTRPPQDESSYVLTPAKAWAYVALLAAWLLPGLAGHDPWKPDEAETFGLVYSILQGGSWVVPTLAGEPFLDAPPLYPLAGAAFARLAGTWLPLHDAARLATACFVVLALVFLKLAARQLLGRTQGWIAMIAFIGCIGLLVRGHLMVPETAELAGLAMALYGFALARKHPVAGGLLIGSGAGAGFLANGTLAPLAVAACAALLPALFRDWRSRAYGGALALALLATAPWLLAWPAALHEHSPALFQKWLAERVWDTLPGLSPVSPGAQLWSILKTVIWTAWPVLPIAAWTLWHGRARALAQPAAQLGLALAAALILFLTFLPGLGESEMLPLLLPLTLLAVAGLHTLRRGEAAFLDWFGIMTFGLFAVLVWLGWLHLLTGHPESLGRRSRFLRAGVALELEWWAPAVAAVITVGWILFVWRVGLGNRRAVINWAAGVTLVWALAIALLLPWVDGFKSYRPVALAVKKQLPARHGCVASRGLTEAPRAMLHYFGGIVTQRLEAKPDADCEFLLLQGPREAPGARWKKVWEGGRPLEKAERFRLYKRVPAEAKG